MKWILRIYKVNNNTQRGIKYSIFLFLVTLIIFNMVGSESALYRRFSYCGKVLFKLNDKIVIFFYL